MENPDQLQNNILETNGFNISEKNWHTYCLSNKWAILEENTVLQYKDYSVSLYISKVLDKYRVFALPVQTSESSVRAYKLNNDFARLARTS